MSTLRYIYLRDEHGQPVSCISTSFHKETTKLVYAISSLNPQDRFDRKVARELAVGRLVLEGTHLDLSDVEDINGHVITRCILEDLLTWEHEELPGRARKAAKRWLQDHPEEQEEQAQVETVVAIAGGSIKPTPTDVIDGYKVPYEDHPDKHAFDYCRGTN